MTGQDGAIYHVPVNMSAHTATTENGVIVTIYADGRPISEFTVYDGYQGFQGFQGVQGYQGLQGPQGFQGFQGYQGFQGFQGLTGSDGQSGSDGAQGYQGFQGLNGSDRHVFVTVGVTNGRIFTLNKVKGNGLIKNGDKFTVIFNHKFSPNDDYLNPSFEPMLFEFNGGSTLSEFFEPITGMDSVYDLYTETQMAVVYRTVYKRGDNTNAGPAPVIGIDPYNGLRYNIHNPESKAYGWPLGGSDVHEFVYSLLGWFPYDSGHQNMAYGHQGPSDVYLPIDSNLTYDATMMPSPFLDVDTKDSSDPIYLPFVVKEGHFNTSDCIEMSGLTSNSPHINRIHGSGYTINVGSGGTLNIQNNDNVDAYVVSYHPNSANTLWYSNNIYMQNGYLFSTSDEREKIYYNDIPCDLELLGRLPKKYFVWSDDPTGDVRIGTSAQILRTMYPELVSEDADGKLGVSYERLSIVALAAIDKLYKRVVSLESEIAELKGRLGG